MKWYAAHAVLYTRFKDGNQDGYVIWENVYLVSGESPEGAEQAACQRAREDEGDQNVDGREAEWVFAGIRRLIECLDPEEHPRHGTEITYSQFQVEKAEDFERFVNGETVDVLYEGK